MNILRVMGCDNLQYGGTERYIVDFAKKCKEKGHKLVLSYNGPLASREFQNDLESHSAIIEPCQLRSKYSFKNLFRIRQLIYKHDIDIVHSYFQPGWRYAAIAGKLCGKYTVKTAGNTPLKGSVASGINISLIHKIRFFFSFYIPCLFLDKLVCISESVKDDFLLFGISPIHNL